MVFLWLVWRVLFGTALALSVSPWVPDHRRSMSHETEVPWRDENVVRLSSAPHRCSGENFCEEFVAATLMAANRTLGNDSWADTICRRPLVPWRDARAHRNDGWLQLGQLSRWLLLRRSFHQSLIKARRQFEQVRSCESSVRFEAGVCVSLQCCRVF